MKKNRQHLYHGVTRIAVYMGAFIIIFIPVIGTCIAQSLLVGEGLEYSTIQQAIDACPAGGAIHISPGIYEEHLLITNSVLLKGEDPETTIIDAGATGRVIRIEMAEKVVIQNLQIRNGLIAAMPEEPAMGGGIWSDTPLMLRNTWIKNNIVQGGHPATNRVGGDALGGGVYARKSLYMQGCVFSGNQSYAGGGDYSANIGGAGGMAYGAAVCCVSGNSWAIDCQYSSNFCKGGMGLGEDGGNAFGGAFYSKGKQTFMVQCLFDENYACLGGYFGSSDTRNGQGMGGAIAVVEGCLVCQKLMIFSNKASSGGALYLNCNALMANSVLYGNQGSQPSGYYGIYKGGAIFNEKSLMLIESTLENNVINDGNGGAVYNKGSFTCSYSTFRENMADGGNLKANTFPMVKPLEGYGGALFNGGDCALYSCHLESNMVHGGSYYYGKSGFGGGISNTGTLLAVACTLNGNHANGGKSVFYSTPGSAYGGGLFNAGSAECQNCTFSANACFGASAINAGHAMGGGLYNNGQLILQHCTIFGNTGNGGSGGSSGPSQGSSGQFLGGGCYAETPVLMGNTVIASNEISGIIESQGYNLIESVGSCVVTGCCDGNILNVAACFLPLDYYGFEIPIHYPMSVSPVIDAGTMDELPLDQCGQARPFDINSITNAYDGSDIGAIEYIDPMAEDIHAWPAFQSMMPSSPYVWAFSLNEIVCRTVYLEENESFPGGEWKTVAEKPYDALLADDYGRKILIVTQVHDHACGVYRMRFE